MHVDLHAIAIVNACNLLDLYEVSPFTKKSPAKYHKTMRDYLLLSGKNKKLFNKIRPTVYWVYDY